MGAKNEGPGSAGKACIFENTNGLVTGLTRNSWYEFYVYAGNTGALGIASNPLWMKTASLPVPVTGLNISMVTVDKVRLVWNVMDPALCTGWLDLPSGARVVCILSRLEAKLLT